jgi:hypothetical protein
VDRPKVKLPLPLPSKDELPPPLPSKIEPPPRLPSKIELPPWLPWATTACLAALVACLGELWIIEKARSELLREDGTLAAAALKASENQIEAERIVNSRELDGLRALTETHAELQFAFLLPPDGGPPGAAAHPAGFVVWDPEGRRGLLRIDGLPAQVRERDYQLWLEGLVPGNSAECGVFHGPTGGAGGAVAIRLSGPVAPGSRFLLVDGAKGGARTLAEATAGGSIVLATLPYAGKIPK